MSARPQAEPPTADPVASRPESFLEGVYWNARSAFRWALAGVYFFTVCPLLILLAVVLGDQKKHDGPQRWLSRCILWLAGARYRVVRSPGFDPKRTCFVVSNHVNLFDPFLLYSTMPQYIRGLELESHFKIPVYGWLMKTMGNVPVPETSTPSDLKRMWRLTRAALDAGTSIVVFAEGKRTTNGRVGEFQDGAFRMALRFGVPIAPVSIVGAFQFNRKTSWMLRPANITVYLHDTIETARMSKDSAQELRDRVWKIVAAPVHQQMEDAGEKPAIS